MQQIHLNPFSAYSSGGGAPLPSFIGVRCATNPLAALSVYSQQVGVEPLCQGAMCNKDLTMEVNNVRERSGKVKRDGPNVWDFHGVL